MYANAKPTNFAEVRQEAEQLVAERLAEKRRHVKYPGGWSREYIDYTTETLELNFVDDPLEIDPGIAEACFVARCNHQVTLKSKCKRQAPTIGGAKYVPQAESVDANELLAVIRLVAPDIVRTAIRAVERAIGDFAADFDRALSPVQLGRANEIARQCGARVFN